MTMIQDPFDIDCRLWGVDLLSEHLMTEPSHGDHFAPSGEIGTGIIDSVERNPSDLA